MGEYSRIILLTLYYEIYSKLYDNRRVDNIKFVIANCWRVFCLIGEVYQDIRSLNVNTGT